MAMGRKDYVAIARVLNEHYNEFTTLIHRERVERIAQDISAVMLADNRNFRPRAFMAAVTRETNTDVGEAEGPAREAAQGRARTA